MIEFIMDDSGSQRHGVAASSRSRTAALALANDKRNVSGQQNYPSWRHASEAQDSGLAIMSYLTTLSVPCLMAIGGLLAVFVVWLLFILTRPLTPQKSSRVFIRAPHWTDERTKPKRWAYDAEVHVAGPAEKFHEFAVLAARSYAKDEVSNVASWTLWEHFPSEDMKSKCESIGLSYQVWEKKSQSESILAVVFRGTDFTSFADWVSNLRWFLRLGPPHKDQYDYVETDLTKSFAEAFTKWAAGQKTKRCRLVSVGHSLGGGLAQCFAYTLPAISCANNVRVSEVYAFASSPVTAEFSVKDSGLRDENAKGLSIYNVFEHGEVLAFLRLLLRTVKCKQSEFPRRWAFRFNLSKSPNPLKSHSMAMLAGLLETFKDMPPTREVDKTDRIQQLQLIYDYIKFHIGLYLATPPILLLLGEGLGVDDDDPFKAGMFDMVILYLVAGVHAAWFMGTHINRQWKTDFLDEFERDAFTPVRRFFHHWFYWAGLIVGLAGLALSIAQR